MSDISLRGEATGAPAAATRATGGGIDWFLLVALILVAITFVRAIYFTPVEATQGPAQKIFYVHAPSAWVAFLAFGIVALTSILYLWLKDPKLDLVAESSAEVGVVFTTMVLISGPLWGKPVWGTWWTWDARLTSELVLLFLFLGVIGLYHAFEDRRQGARAAAFLAIIGIINVPIVHFSVNWWNTLHQGSTVNVFGQSKMSWDMLWPLLTMTLATKFYYAASLFRRVRTDLLALEGGKDWVRRIAEDEVDR